MTANLPAVLARQAAGGSPVDTERDLELSVQVHRTEFCLISGTFITVDTAEIVRIAGPNNDTDHMAIHHSVTDSELVDRLATVNARPLWRHTPAGRLS